MRKDTKTLSFPTAFSTYISIEKIGSGGSGDVYKAMDENKDVFAVKLLAPDRVSKDKLRRFKNELFFCSKCEHKNIIKVLEWGYTNLKGKKCPFFIMPYYQETLRGLMKKGIPTDQVLRYFSQILDGVEAAHLQGIWHRDLKPENILYDPSSEILVIADFGIAHFTEDWLYTLVETKSQERLANFQYAAPEQRIRREEIDQRADIYALGMILNEMFTEQAPHGTGYKTIGSVSSEYEYLDDLVTDMLKQSPEERPDTIEAIKNQLIARKNEFVTQQKISALKRTVIPEADIDDPLIEDPPRLINFDWNKGVLTLVLSHSVNPTWIWALQNMGSYGSLLGKGPEHFSFSKNRATISAREEQVQDIIDYFNLWLPRANQVYERKIRQEKREAEKRERQELEQKIEEEEARKRVLKKVKI